MIPPPGQADPGTARLTAFTSEPIPDKDPCLLPPESGYTGLENQLYRVEVHDATRWKWSRENGSVTTVIERLLASEPGKPGGAVIVAFLPAFLAAGGWDPVAAGGRASVLTWSAGAATVAGGWLADRVLGRTTAVILGAASCTLCAALLPPTGAALVLLVAAGLTFALFPAALTAQVGEATPPSARGTVFGWYSGASYVGLTITPWLAGWLRDITANPAAPIFLAAVLLAAFLPAYAWFRAEVSNSPTARA